MKKTTATPRPETVDFLSVSSDERLQCEAANILDSYANPWDLLAEALQNAVDAVEARAQADPDGPNQVHIEFDAARRSIVVSDTGVGMSRDQLQRVLTPHISLKRGDQRSRGEKGIGLSFLVFSCNAFELTTCNGEECTVATVKNAADWASERTTTRPKMKIGPADPDSSFGSRSYTVVRLGPIPARDDGDPDVFSYSFERLVHILRTRTAVGNTRHLFDRDGRRPEVGIDVELSFTPHSGMRKDPFHVDFAYADPASYLPSREVLDFDDYKQLLMRKQDQGARGKSLIYRCTQLSDGGRSLRCYAFASSRTTYRQISKDYGLKDSTDDDLQPGIFVSTRSMPTGIQIPSPRTTLAGYWENLYIVIEDDSLRFDVGRKSVRGRAVTMFRNAALAIFRELLPHMPEIRPEGTEAQRMRQTAELVDAWDEAKKLPDLGVPRIPYLKEPSHEQGVVALFHELLGARVIHGYRTYRNSSKDQYDALIRYTARRDELGRNEQDGFKGETASFDIVVEFKYDGADLLDDISQNQKRYEDINLLVCWQLDENRLTGNQVKVEPVSPADIYFLKTTHKLLFGPHFGLGQHSQLPVIVLRDVLREEGTATPAIRRPR